MNEIRFRELVEQAIDDLPDEFAKKLDNVAIVIEDTPSSFQLKKVGLTPRSLLLGLYEGIPQGKRGAYSGALPDKITIFKKPIELIADTDEAIKKLVSSTVIHEIGHHFGLSDRELK